ncbi:MAG: glycosyltransferase family 2 protein [Bacteroidales bacterium]|nr:glycosyltransferase family 2 protein [Bacteroidales bacterium]
MVSLVIPVYNAERHLEMCLSSVLAQSYPDWECILVDDGSTDSSAGICDSYARKDRRFKVIRQKNRGVSAARNAGLGEIHGENCCFVDADDWMEPPFLERMVAAAGVSDLVVSGQIRESGSGQSREILPEAEGVFPLSSENAPRFVRLEKSGLLYAPHEKLYRTRLIRESGAAFPEGCSYGEDLVFNFRYLERVRSLCCVREALYHYRQDGSGLSFSFRPNRFEEDYGHWKLIRSFYESRDLWCREAAEYLYRELWGIVYDGLFLYPRLHPSPEGYLERILGIDEINILGAYAAAFPCAGWIKRAILHRNSLLFHAVFRGKALLG